MSSRPLLPYHWTPSSATAPSTTPTPPAAVAGAEARDVGSGGAFRGPPGNDDEEGAELVLAEKGNEEHVVDCEKGLNGSWFVIAGQFPEVDSEHAGRAHAQIKAKIQSLGGGVLKAPRNRIKGRWRLPKKATHLLVGEAVDRKLIDDAQDGGVEVVHLQRLHPLLLCPGPVEATAVAVAPMNAVKTAAELERTPHRHVVPRVPQLKEDHAHLPMPPHHHAQSAYQLPPPSYHAVGAYHLPPHAVGRAHPPPPQFHAVGPYHWREAAESEEEMARRNASIYALGAYQDEEASRREEEEMVCRNARSYALGAYQDEEASRREAAEREETRQWMVAVQEEEMARRRSGRDARINAFREYRDKEANALTSSTSRAEIKDPELDAKQPEETPKKNAELDVSYLLSEKAKFEEMRSRLGAAMESLGDPEATKEAKQALRGKRDKIISGIPRGEKRATRSLAETERFVAFCLKCSGYYNCECCCKARAAKVMDQAVEKLKQEEKEEIFELSYNLFSSDH